LGTGGQYELVALDVDGIYRSRVVPGFWLRVAWLWQQQLSDPVQALLEIDRDAFGQYLQEQLRQAGLWRALTGTGFLAPLSDKVKADGAAMLQCSWAVMSGDGAGSAGFQPADEGRHDAGGPRGRSPA
jgi:hypothetical protein